MKDLLKTLPAIIKQSAQSELGILALMVVALAIICYLLFRKSDDKIRFAAFITFFIGVAAFGGRVVYVGATQQKAAKAVAITSPVGPAPAAVKSTQQKTDGNNSPAVSGVGGDFNYSVNGSSTQPTSRHPSAASVPEAESPAKVIQETKGANSPAVQGVNGSVTVKIEDRKRP